MSQQPDTDQKFYKTLEDYQAYKRKVVRLQQNPNPKGRDHTIDKLSMFAEDAFEAMERERNRLIRQIEAQSIVIAQLIEYAVPEED